MDREAWRHMAELWRTRGIDADFQRVHNPCDALITTDFLLLSLLLVIQAEATTKLYF
ncbi:hypothetical protein Hanom_Chr05g00397391 [Helianthus anomalus]